MKFNFEKYFEQKYEALEEEMRESFYQTRARVAAFNTEVAKKQDNSIHAAKEMLVQSEIHMKSNIKEVGETG